MPNAQKELIVSDLRDLAQGSKGAILTDYRGLTVAEVTRLRLKLRESDAEYHIVKNTLYKIAVGKETVTPELEKLLTGPTAILFAKSDVVAPTKAILDFLRDLKKPDIKVKGGYIDGKIYNVDQVTALSKLPPREQIIATLIGTLDGPAANFVSTLDNIIGSFVRTIQAIADKTAESGPIFPGSMKPGAAAPEAPAVTETPAAAPNAEAASEAPVSEAAPEPVAETTLESGEASASEASTSPVAVAETLATTEAAETAQLDNAPVEPVAEATAEPAATAERDAAPVEAAVEDAEKTSE